MTFKDFKGQVKISDVQKAFDNLVERINDSIDAYNESSYVTDINYNNVSEELAPLNYTLSVGGLKKILEIYDGYAGPLKSLNGRAIIDTRSMSDPISAMYSEFNAL